MRNEHDHAHEHDGVPAALHHDCGNLFGCGDEKGTGVVREDIKDGAVTPKSADRLLHMDEIDQEQFDGYLTARGCARRNLLRASGFMSALAALGPAFARLAQAATPSTTSSGKPTGLAASIPSSRPRRPFGSACSTRPCRRS